MPYRLIIPGLLWPASRTPTPAGGLALPALETILGHARPAARPAQSLDRCLADLFGLATDALPHAALRRAGEPVAPLHDIGTCLCADPVNLHFAREHLLLADASGLEIREDEAARIIEGLNETLSDIGRFEAPAADRWYLWSRKRPEANFAALSDVAGRPVGLFMPEGIQARDWHRLSNEIQVWLHGHPVNAAREASGFRPINSLWFWGAGDPPSTLQRPAQRIQANGTLARGLVRFAGLVCTDSTRLDIKTGSSALAILEQLQQSAQYLNLDDWRNGLIALERDWFAPALAALKTGSLDELRITAPCERATLDFTLKAGSLWRFWKHPLPLDAFHKSIA